jgi:hypothetical protein
MKMQTQSLIFVVLTNEINPTYESDVKQCAKEFGPSRQTSMTRLMP